MLEVEKALKLLQTRSDLVKRLEGEKREQHVMMFETVSTGKHLGIWLGHPRGRKNGIRIKLEKIPNDLQNIEIIECAKSDGLSKPKSRIPNGKGVCVFVSEESELVTLLHAYNGASTAVSPVSAPIEDIDGESRPFFPSPADDFGQPPNDNLAELNSYARKVRRGQKAFRDILLKLYSGKCAITGEGPPVVLEAAHIWEHASSGVNHSSNGLLLRADMHILFDERLININPDSFLIEVSPSLAGTQYERFNGKPLLSRSDGSHLSKEFLEKRYKNTAG